VAQLSLRPIPTSPPKTKTNFVRQTFPNAEARKDCRTRPQEKWPRKRAARCGRKLFARKSPKIETSQAKKARRCPPEMKQSRMVGEERHWKVEEGALATGQSPHAMRSRGTRPKSLAPSRDGYHAGKLSVFADQPFALSPKPKTSTTCFRSNQLLFEIKNISAFHPANSQQRTPVKQGRFDAWRCCAMRSAEFESVAGHHSISRPQLTVFLATVNSDGDCSDFDFFQTITRIVSTCE